MLIGAAFPLNGSRYVNAGRSKIGPFAEFLGLISWKLRSGCKFLVDLGLIGSSLFGIDLVGLFGNICQNRYSVIADLNETGANGKPLGLPLGRDSDNAGLQGRNERSVLRHDAGLAGKCRDGDRIYLGINYFSFWSYDLKFKHLDFSREKV